MKKTVHWTIYPGTHRQNNDLAVNAAKVLAGEDMQMKIIERSQRRAVPLSAYIFVTVILAQIKSHHHIEPA